MPPMTRRSMLATAGAISIALPFLGRNALGSQTSATPVASPSASPEAGGIVQITIEAIDFAFIEPIITAPAEAELEITLINHGRTAHDFVIDELDLRVDAIRPGESATFSVSGPAGEYDFYCSLNSHRIAGQEGVLILEA